MTTNANEYWPFPVSEEDKQWPEMIEKIAFLEQVSSEGFKGYRSGINDYGAESTTHDGVIIERGRKRWEFRLSDNGNRQLSGFVSEFVVAGKALASWLKGASVDEILSDVRNELVVPPGTSASYTISEGKKMGRGAPG